MERPQARSYEFGEFIFDVRRRELSKNGQSQPISSRIADLLIVLLESEGRILTHEELLDMVWADSFVEQSNLKKSVSTLRQVLGERPDESQYIKTIPRKGYCFVADVKSIYDEPASEPLTGTVVAEAGKPTEQPSFERTDQRHRLKYQILGLIAVLALGGAAFVGYRYLSAERTVSFSFDQIEVTRLTTDGKYFDSAVSPDGNYLVHSTREGKKNLLVLHQLATGRNSTLASFEDVSYWSYIFTRDGNFVYFLVKNWAEPSKTGIYRVPFLGGEQKLILPTKDGGGLTFSQDGKVLAFQNTDENGNPQIQTISADGTNYKKIISFDAGTRLWSLSFTPDGKSLLFVIRRETPDLQNLFSVRTVSVEDLRETTLIAEQKRAIHQAVWTADAKSLLLLVREENAELRQIWQYTPGQAEWSRVTNDNESYRNINILADGKSIVATRESMNSSIWTADSEPYNFRQVTGGLNQYAKANWTGDNRIAYLTVENKAEILTVMSETGRNKQAISKGDDGMWMEPTIGGDGNSIVFVSNRTGSLQIWKSALDGSAPTQLTKSDSQVFNGRLLKDGKTLFFQKYVSSVGWCLFRQIGDEPPVRLTQTQISGWDISPDESKISGWLEDASTKKREAVILDPATGQLLRKLDGFEPDVLRWTPDGNSLAFVAQGEDASELRIKTLDGNGAARTAASVPAENIFWFDWSDSGKLVLVRGKRLADAVKITTTR